MCMAELHIRIKSILVHPSNTPFDVPHNLIFYSGLPVKILQTLFAPNSDRHNISKYNQCYETMLLPYSPLSSTASIDEANSIHIG